MVDCIFGLAFVFFFIFILTVGKAQIAIKYGDISSMTFVTKNGIVLFLLSLHKQRLLFYYCFCCFMSAFPYFISVKVLPGPDFVCDFCISLDVQ